MKPNISRKRKHRRRQSLNSFLSLCLVITSSGSIAGRGICKRQKKGDKIVPRIKGKVPSSLHSVSAELTIWAWVGKVSWVWTNSELKQSCLSVAREWYSRWGMSAILGWYMLQLDWFGLLGCKKSSWGAEIKTVERPLVCEHTENNWFLFVFKAFTCFALLFVHVGWTFQVWGFKWVHRIYWIWVVEFQGMDYVNELM